MHGFPFAADMRVCVPAHAMPSHYSALVLASPPVHLQYVLCCLLCVTDCHQWYHLNNAYWPFGACFGHACLRHASTTRPSTTTQLLLGFCFPPACLPAHWSKVASSLHSALPPAYHLCTCAGLEGKNEGRVGRVGPRFCACNRPLETQGKVAAACNGCLRCIGDCCVSQAWHSKGHALHGWLK